MPWRVEFDGELDVIRCIYAGSIALDDFKGATFEAIALARKHNAHRVLIDTAELDSAISTMEIYSLPEFYETTRTDRHSKWAFVLPPAGQIREDAKFYVTVCKNRGWYIRAFDHRREAVAWLVRKNDVVNGA